MAVPFSIPTNYEQVFLLPTSWPTFGVVSVLDFNHSNRYGMLSFYCFNLHFPDDRWCGASFHMLICHIYIFFTEVCVLWPVLKNMDIFLLMIFKNSYIFWMSYLSDVSSQKWLCIFVKNQLTVFMWLFSWALYSIAFISIYPLPKNTLSWLLHLRGNSPNKAMWVVWLCSFSQNWFHYYSTLAFPRKF